MYFLSDFQPFCVRIRMLIGFHLPAPRKFLQSLDTGHDEAKAPLATSLAIQRILCNSSFVNDKIKFQSSS